MANPNLLALSSTKGRTFSTQVASGNSTIYTAGASTLARIATLTLCNVSGAAVVVSVSLIPPGGALDGTHKVVSNYSVAAGDSTNVTELAGALVEAGASVVVNSSAATAIDATLTLFELS